MSERDSSAGKKIGRADRTKAKGRTSSTSLDDWATLIASLLCIGAGIVLAFCLVKREYPGTTGWVAAISFVLIGGLVVVLRHVELYGYDGRRRLILRRRPEEVGDDFGDD